MSVVKTEILQELLALDAELAELKCQRAALDVRIEAVAARHHALVRRLAGESVEEIPTRSRAPIPKEILDLLQDKERTLRERVLLCLAIYKDEENVTTADVAVTVADESKRVLMALQDLRAKTPFVTKPGHGYWKLSHPEGLAEVKRRWDMSLTSPRRSGFGSVVSQRKKGKH